MIEEIHNPRRYTQNKIECWDFNIKYQVDGLIWSVVKYVWRHKEKNGIQDLEKALEYLRKRKETPIFYGLIPTISWETYEVVQREDFPAFDNFQFEIIRSCSTVPLSMLDGEEIFLENMEDIEGQVIDYIEHLLKENSKKG